MHKNFLATSSPPPEINIIPFELRQRHAVKTDGMKRSKFIVRCRQRIAEGCAPPE